MIAPRTRPPSTMRPLRRAAVWVATLATAFAGVGVVTAGPVSAVDDGDWLGVVNAYRSLSGLAPLTANPTWSAQARDHSCYMLQNGISHDEIPGRPGYTSGGDVAGNSGNVAVSSSMSATARDHIDLWMTGPFHAIGVLRHNLRSTGFGICTGESTPTPWRSGATLDVLRGIDGAAPRPSAPIVFPGNGTTTPLHSFVTEYPNPVTLCGWTGSAGLPLIAMMPADADSATSTLTGPSGPIETCTLTAGNTGADATARAILDGDNAVIVLPRAPLADGTYTAAVQSSGGAVSWTFTVDRDAPLGSTPTPIADTAPTAAPTRLQPITPFRLVDSREGKGTVRLVGGRVSRVRIASSDTVAVSANITAVRPAASGYLTAYHCTQERPTVSSLGFAPGPAVANQVIVPLRQGELCLYASADVDVLIDVNGYFRDESSTGKGYHPMQPGRLLDTRSGTSLAASVERRITVTGGRGAPAGASAVALNLTSVRSRDGGWLQAYPCGGTATQSISSVNYAAGDVRPNSVVVPVGSGGQVCLRSSAATDVLVDITGYFDGNGGYDFVALEPVRLVDTRDRQRALNPFTDGARVGAGRVLRVPIAGVRGIPADAEAATINLTAVRADRPTFMTAYPCGTRPPTSNLNLAPPNTIAANGALVELDAHGDLCIYVDQPAHVIVDITGVWR